MWKDEIYLLKLALTIAALYAAMLIAGTYFTARESYNNLDAKKTVFSEKELGWDFKNYRDFNDCGLREPLSCEKLMSLDKDKILFLGNSVVAGLGFDREKTFTKVFQHNIGDRFYVVNGGIDGYAIYREFKKFKRDLEKLDFHSVFWFITRSDIRRRSHAEALVNETKEAQGVFESKDDGGKIDFIDVYIMSLKNNAFMKSLKNRFCARTEQWFDGWKDHFYSNGILNVPERLDYNDMMSELASFNDYLRQRDINLIVVFLPDRTFSSFYRWKDAAMYREVAGGLDSKDIPWISLVNDFPERYSYKYYFDYVHFNEEGHEFVGSRLAKKYMPTETKR